MKEFTFTDPLYQANISYLIGGDVPELISFIKKRHKNSQMYSFGEKFYWEEDADTTNAYQFHITSPLGKSEIFYVWVSEKTPYLLAHETFHLTGDILYNRGVKYCMESEEAFAYLHGWIFSEMFKLLRGIFRKR
jgi:hypothetical protein